MNNKVFKKIQRAKALLRNHEPTVIISDSPTEILYVANSGVVCGVECDELERILTETCPKFELYVFKNKPYTFIKLPDIASASTLFDAWQGKCPSKISNEGISFYLSYVENLPESCLASSDAVSPPKGLKLIENFVSEDEERELIRLVDDLDRSAGSSDNLLKHRRVYHFGYTFLYKGNKADLDGPPADPMPDSCSKLVDKFIASGLIDKRLDQLTVNVYESGQGIPLHTDTHSAFEEEIFSLSLLSQVVMDFICPENGTKRTVTLPGRSLLVLKGESRYVWHHGISPRKYDSLSSGMLIRRHKRISFTFRTIRRTPCQCAFPRFCDWNRENHLKENADEDLTPSELEQKYVYEVYDRIADHFDRTRHSQWGGVKSFLDSLPRGSTLFDVGCGNGKYLQENNDELVKLGCDRSVGLCSICQEKRFNVCIADCLNVPICDERFDAVISIAVIHHLSNEVPDGRFLFQQRRRKAIQEIVRILKPGGTALIYVWAYEQKRKGETSFYLQTGSSNKTSPNEDGDDDQYSNRTKSDVDSSSVKKSLPIHENRTNFKVQDTLVPWDLKTKNDGKSSDERFLRFYHVFKEGELENVCRSIENCFVTKSFYEQGNWCVVIEKR